MSYNLFLDDFRYPEDSFEYTHNLTYISEDWTTVRNYDDFVKVITERGIPEIISFDHDLADEHYDVQLPYEEYKEKTGYECAKWLINYCIDNKKELPATIFIHSMNVAGSANIKSLFDTYYKYHDKGLL
jgi:hypothetical protein